jgi:hypothetical protein
VESGPTRLAQSIQTLLFTISVAARRLGRSGVVTVCAPGKEKFANVAMVSVSLLCASGSLARQGRVFTIAGIFWPLTLLAVRRTAYLSSASIICLIVILIAAVLADVGLRRAAPAATQQDACRRHARGRWHGLLADDPGEHLEA